MPITLDGTNGITTPTYGGADTSEYLVPVTAFKNRIINGAMVIDQRNAGASITPTDGQYVVDRFSCRLTQSGKYSAQQDAGAVTPPAGFTDYIGATSLSAYSVLSTDNFQFQHRVEGFNVADLAWGTANAKTVTLSFWVRSSLTGTFGGSLLNAAGSRSYPFAYTISAANTWEYKTITIAGDTSGTWNTTNGRGIEINFSLGAGTSQSGTAGAWSSSAFFSATGATSVVGTNGATFYITGVQLEVGSTATSFDYRPYGTEFNLCMRYFQGLTYNSSLETGGMRIICTGNNGSNPLTGWLFPVPMRASPTMTSYGAGSAGGTFAVYDVGGGSSSQTNFNSITSCTKGVQVNYTGRANYGTYWIDCGTGGNGHGWTASAEL